MKEELVGKEHELKAGSKDRRKGSGHRVYPPLKGQKSLGALLIEIQGKV